MKRAAGLTLIEVLVAMLLLALVSAAALAFVARGRATQRSGESLARLEETLDAASAVLIDEIRMAGYLGLTTPGTPVDGASPLGATEASGLEVAGNCGPSLAHDLFQPLVAIDGEYAAAPGLPLGCRPSPEGRVVAGTDALIVRRAAAESTVAQAGRLQLETSLRSARLAADGAGRLGAEARWHDLEVSVFYVSADSTGRRNWPSLRRKRLLGGARPAFQDEELVSGIEDLQIEVGAEPAGGSTRLLRIRLGARSDVPEATEPDGRRHRQASRVVALRNTGVAP
jgi:prepilin-type N-terminal cleavage/methylation domain-containing protein